MHTIIAITLVSAAQALLQCSDYCKLISYNQPMEWRPDCNCSVIKKEMLQTNTLLGDTSNFLYDTDANNIYYEPAERYRLSFLDQPFYIINPTAPTLSKQSLSQNRRQGRENNGTNTKNIKQTHFHKLKIDTEELPLYLDIDIQNPAGQGRSTSQELLKTDFQRTENYLLKCLDLNVLIISRKNGVSGDNIESLNSKNMELYSGLSDSELMAALKEKCELPASVMEQSLQEVKGNLPRKNKSTARFKNKVYKEVTSESLQKGLIKFSKDITTDAPYVKRTIANDLIIEDPIRDYINYATIFHEDVRNNFETDATSPPGNYEKITLSHINIDNILNDQNDIKTTTNYYQNITVKTNSEHISKNISDYQERPAYQEKNSNNNNLFTTHSLDLSFNETEKIIASTDPVSTTENVPIDHVDLHILSQYPPEQKEKNLDELNLDTRSAITVETLTRTSSNDNDKKYFSSTSNYADLVNNNLINKDSTSSSVIANDMTTTRFERTQYLEGDYQIPKIISKELSNNTLLSEVDGNETIPNLDFGAYKSVLNNSFENNLQTFDDVTSTHILDNEYITSSEFTTASNVEQIITDDENIQSFSSDELKINGELYFIYGHNGHNKIPARFVQNSDGKINVAIDGASICDELFKRGEKISLLVTSLCNCVQSHNCTGDYD